MSESTREEHGDVAEVVDLACARFGDALIEGNLDERARTHVAGCSRCSAMQREMEVVADLIAEATAPGPLDSSFEQGMLERAREMTFDLERTPDPTPWANMNNLRRLGLSLAAAAALTVAYWAGGEQQNPETRTVPEPAPITMAGSSQASVVPTPPPIPTGPAGGPVVMIPKAVTSAGEVTTTSPLRPLARVIPEPIVDLPVEVRDALVRHIQTQEGCPDQATRAVRLTVTVEKDGSITNRQILSSAAAGDAHRCVTRAVDALLLPPLPEPATLTLDITW